MLNSEPSKYAQNLTFMILLFVKGWWPRTFIILPTLCGKTSLLHRRQNPNLWVFWKVIKYIKDIHVHLKNGDERSGHPRYKDTDMKYLEYYDQGAYDTWQSYFLNYIEACAWKYKRAPGIPYLAKVTSSLDKDKCCIAKRQKGSRAFGLKPL